MRLYICATAGVLASMVVSGDMEHVNWSNNVQYCGGSSSCEYVEPTTEKSLRNLVKQAESNGRRVHVAGTRHSFSTVADVPKGGVHVSARAMSGIVSLTPAANMSSEEWSSFSPAPDAVAVVEVLPGTTYDKVGDYLFKRGLALRNYASLPHISVAGAVSTWTHGSGVSQGSLSTHVLGVRVVTGGGRVVELRKGRDGDFFGAVVAIGGLGIVSRVWLETVPAFDVAQCIHPRVLALPVLNAARGSPSVPQLMRNAYSTSIFIDYSDPERFASVWRKIALPPGVGEASPDVASGGELPGTDLSIAELMGGAAQEGAACKGLLALDSQPIVPSGSAFHPVPEQPAQDCTPAAVAGPGHWRLPHFRPDGQPSAGGDELQSEFFIRLSQASDAIRALTQPGTAGVLAPLVRVTEVRAVAEDDFWLSPCRRFPGADGEGSNPCVGVHFTWVHDVDGVTSAGLPAVLEALAPFEPVPHLGKVPGMHPAEAGRRYEERTAGGVSLFERLRSEMDPNGTFMNDYLDGFLGAATAMPFGLGDEL